MRILRGGEEVFAGETSLAQLKRTPEELVQWLFADNEFPDGVLLLTGTGLVPPGKFTLAAGDEISIRIDGVGTLVNVVEP
jgi:2-dehydro-3-deoxy-D-arabinonate dehydratase